MTHRRNTPWSITRNHGKKIMDMDAIKRYFIIHFAAMLKDRMKTEELSTLPADWYDPDEDAEWETYQ